MLKIKHRFHNPSGTGRRSGYHQRVDQVNFDDAYPPTFQGQYLPHNRQVELAPNNIVIRKTPKGSASNPIIHWQYAHVPETGLSWSWSKPYLDHEFLDFRDAVAEAQQGLTRLDDEPLPLFLTIPPDDQWPDPKIPNAEELTLTLQTILDDTGIKTLTWSYQKFALIPALSGKRVKTDTRRLIAEASQFIATMTHRLPEFVRPNLRWENLSGTITDVDDAIFQAYFGATRDQLESISRATAHAEDKLLAHMADQTISAADARARAYRAQVWSQVEKTLGSMGFRLEPQQDQPPFGRNLRL